MYEYYKKCSVDKDIGKEMKKLIIKVFYCIIMVMVVFVAYGFSSNPDISAWREGWEELNND